MSILLLAAAGFLVWYLVQHQAERPVWPWVGLGVLALGLFHGGGMGFGMMGGMYGGRGYGRDFMHYGMMGPGGHWANFDPATVGSWWWVAMGIKAVLVIALVIVAAILVRRAVKTRAEANSPLGILKTRLARGEISVDEYEVLKGKLQG
ncbi:MAG TPA: SHOCT domain-containing protein [Symbiobacteriaceae bacterium]|nr:SHOCT domain-containing protein [Symbiobacteriaceae bacterium]